ncbi:MAG TPA: inositol monophosphatase family protein [archaeon]|nr:inositol monophosphatase family protein [archaeon]
MKELIVAESAAFAAGKIAMKYFQEELTIKKKGKIDLVTNVDIECEQKIKKVISEEFRKHSFLGEESGKDGNSEYVWIIDPIDGTTNFAHGLDNFSHSIALAKNNELICGVVYNPVQKKMFKAYTGKGAFLNGKKIKVSSTQTVVDSLVVTGFPYENDSLGEKAVSSVRRLRGNCQGIRRFGSAALDFCYIAQGVMDAYFEYDLKSWDAAAGMLIAREAGAKVTDINGNEASLDTTHFLASNGKIHDEIMKYLERV